MPFGCIKNVTKLPGTYEKSAIIEVEIEKSKD
jgi:hypothetical protein